MFGLCCALKNILNRQRLENQQRQLLSHMSHRNPIGSAVIIRYVKLFLNLAEIYVNLYTANFTRSLSSISGKLRLSLKDIQKTVGLSQSTNFENYHSKIIMVPPYYRVIQ